MGQETGEEGTTVVAVLEPVYVHLGITDPDVVAAVNEYAAGVSRTEFVQVCLKVGVLALRAAKGVVDGDAIRKSGEHLIGQMTERMTSHREIMEGMLGQTLRSYFDPRSGSFVARVENLVKADGDLANVVAAQVGDAGAKLRDLLNGFVGPDSALTKMLEPGESNAFVQQMQDRVRDLIEAQQAAVVAEFSLDKEDSALSRLVRELKAHHGDMSSALAMRTQEVVAEFSLDKPDSALSRLVGRVEHTQKSLTEEFSLDRKDSSLRRMLDEINNRIDQTRTSQSEFQKEVIGMLSGLAARKKAEARSTTHGAEFEARVGACLAEMVQGTGDVLEDCGTTTGLIRASKVGDFVVELSRDSSAAGAKIVVEAKESQAYTMKMTLEEADEARRNRGAAVCVFVHSAKTAPENLEPLARYGSDVVLTWDAEDPTSDVILKAGMMLAKAMSVRKAVQSTKSAAGFAVIDKAIETLRKQLNGFVELKTSAETVERSAKKSQERIRIMAETMEEAVEAIVAQLDGVRIAEEAGSTSA